MQLGAEATWRQGELYEVFCLLAIAVCIWLIGDSLGLFSILQKVSFDNGMSGAIFLGFFMSFALAIASLLKSFRLRREMTARREAESAAKSIARRDALTGLPNRRMLTETIEAAAATRPSRSHAVLLVDLDRFKPVNDIYGHAAGDLVLCAMAERLRDILPHDATVARLGGDEFAAFLPGMGLGDDLMRLAQKLVTRMSEPVPWQHTRVDVGATVGIALMPQDGSDAETLLRSADIAMYRGKREGRGAFRFFEQSMDDELKARVSLECALRDAIACGQIRPHYQPLVSLPDRKLLGFEVLARWYHPEKGVIAPSVFIPIAEDTNLIADLSFSLLRQACRDAREWPSHLGLAINISPVQFKDRLLAPRILAILSESGFKASRLEIEITESALTSDIEGARETLAMLQGAGVSVALDDFGTGYSSLYHLRELKFDRIKIDRSFVQSLNEGGESSKIVSAILGLGRSLGISTTAEGIECIDNSDWLVAQGCTTGQGYLFGHAIPASAVDASFEPEPAPAANRQAA